MQKFIEHTNTLSPWQAFVLRSTRSLSNDIRAHFARRHLRGDGIEIGAQCNPLKIPRSVARLSHIDRLTPEATHALHGLPVEGVVRPDIVGEADDLSFLADRSLNFVIVNHLLEHTDDPMRALVEWLRVLKEGGILFISVPNYKTNEYDFMRTPATIEHFASNHAASSPSQRTAHKIEHWKEYIASVDNAPPGSTGFSRLIEQYKAMDNRIHFHVYSRELIEDVFRHIRDTLRTGIVVRNSFLLSHGYEFILVVEKNSSGNCLFPAGRAMRLIKNAALVLFLRLRMLTGGVPRAGAKRVLQGRPEES
jgi:SAM-dependent methyltransferase